MNTTKKEFQRALRQKQDSRENIQNLSFPEKYNMLVAIQKRRSEMLKETGVDYIVWPEWKTQTTCKFDKIKELKKIKEEENNFVES